MTQGKNLWGDCGLVSSAGEVVGEKIAATLDVESLGNRSPDL